MNDDKIIFLDMDGVLVDFMTGALKLFDRVDLLEDWPEGCESVYKALGILSSEFWDKVHNEGPDFWANLEPYPWFQYLMHGASCHGEVFLLTSPSRHPSCVAGKKMWINKWLKPNYRNYIFCPGEHKHLMADSNRILIDDFESTCNAFGQSGGTFFIFGRPWNINYKAESGWSECERIINWLKRNYD